MNRILCPNCKKHKPLYHPFYDHSNDDYYGVPHCYKCIVMKERWEREG